MLLGTQTRSTEQFSTSSTPSASLLPHLLSSFPFLLTGIISLSNLPCSFVFPPPSSLSLSVSFCRSLVSRLSCYIDLFWQTHLPMLLPFLYAMQCYFILCCIFSKYILCILCLICLYFYDSMISPSLSLSFSPSLVLPLLLLYPACQQDASSL